MVFVDCGFLWLCRAYPFCLVLFLFLIFLNVYSFFRERECVCDAGERQRKTRGQRIQSRLSAVSREPNVGLQLMNREIMTWSEAGCLTNWAIQAPRPCLVLFLLDWSVHNKNGSIFLFFFFFTKFPLFHHLILVNFIILQCLPFPF